MPSRRESIEMTPEEVRDYLKEQRRIILVTNGSNGMPHPVPMNFGIDDEGRIVMTSFRKAQKTKNLERDPRATLLVESGDGYDDLKSVMLYTDVELINGPEEVAKAMGFIRGNGAMSTSFTDGMNDQVRTSFTKRVVMRFTPFQTISWDHTKLDGVY
ncbi:MAG: pyridoxamine 5'-phosphate oxidase family protein [Sphingomonadaceae bacterium]|nr:pyridoxamine 5'-phosphate oxidase family protein [Sphingomonadaceae bacterium]